MSEYANSPLIENGPITDVYADGIHRMEVFGDNVRMILYRMRGTEDGAGWQRIALDIALVRPVRSLVLPLKSWPNVLRIEPPERFLAGVH